jgi:hypothetical protein
MTALDALVIACFVGGGLCIGYIIGRLQEQALQARRDAEERASWQAPLTKFKEDDPDRVIIERAMSSERSVIELDDYTRGAPHLPGDSARPMFGGVKGV